MCDKPFAHKTYSMKFTFLFTLLFFNFLYASADITPTPVKVKGIVPRYPVNIQMVSEKVVVDLFKDSSIVTCTFNMKNFGNSKEIEIGFPMMSFYNWRDNTADVKDKFDVWVNDKLINKVNIYIPEELKKDVNEDITAINSRLSLAENENKPWYLWKTKFAKNESVQIIVKYSLPSGVTKLKNYFNYLLSTGAGWKGKIIQADVIVNLKDIPADQLIKISPAGYIKTDKQISWTFKNLEPTTNDDILIDYELVKGSYQKRLAESIANAPTYYVDDLLVDSLSDLDPKTIANVLVLNDVVSRKGIVQFFTKPFVHKKFLEKINALSPEIFSQLAKENEEDLKLNYVLIVNDEITAQSDFWRKISELNKSAILTLEIKMIDNKKLIVVKEKI